MTETNHNLPEEEELSTEILIHLAESRSNLYDSFASNALTLLGIQLAILPLSFAVASFVASPNIPSSIEANETAWVLGQVTMGLICLVASVILSFDVFRLAKKKQYSWLNLLGDICYSVFHEEAEFEHLGERRTQLAKLSLTRSQYLNDKSAKVTDKLDFDREGIRPEDELRRELGTRLSDEHQFRVYLLVSMMLALSAAFFVVSGILTTLGLGWFVLILTATFAAIIAGYTLFVYMNLLALLAHAPIRGISDALAFIWTMLTPGIRLGGEWLAEYVGSRINRYKENE